MLLSPQFISLAVFSRPAQNENSGLAGNAEENTCHNKYDTRSKRKSQSNKQYRSRPSALPPLNNSAQQQPPRKRSFHEKQEDNRNNNNGAGIDEGITGFAINSPTKANATASTSNLSHSEGNEVTLKPLPHLGGDIELRSLAMTIRQDIIQTSPGVAWDDIADLSGELDH